MSGDGEVMIVGPPNCKIAKSGDSGQVDIYGRSGSAWQLDQTIESPERSYQAEFGDVVSVSDDGSTATAASRLAGPGSPNSAGAAWVLIRKGGSWSLGAHLTAPKLEEYAGFDCPAIAAGGARIVWQRRSGRLQPSAGLVVSLRTAERRMVITSASPTRLFAPGAHPKRTLASPRGSAGKSLPSLRTARSSTHPFRHGASSTASTGTK